MRMKKNNFTFVGNRVLRNNMEHVLADVYGLLFILGEQDDRVRSCLRKTAIIYIASIVEALLLWKIGSDEVVLPDDWKQYDIRVLYRNEEFELISARRKREIKDIAKLDFNRMIIVCRQKKLLGETLLKELDALRKLRNKLHIGGIEEVTKMYAPKDVESALETLEKTIRSVQ